MKLRTVLSSTLLAMISASAMAQIPAPATPRVDARQAHQEQRIEQGRASGTLTRREARHLQHDQRHISRAEARTKADGRVTPYERQRLARLQNRASNDIRQQKHDAQLAPRR